MVHEENNNNHCFIIKTDAIIRLIFQKAACMHEHMVARLPSIDTF